MNIGGLQKFSLIDYPGRIGAIVFTQGCNFRCPYCHNPELVDPDRYGTLLPEDEVVAFLERRRGQLEAVTLTGGEPTLQPDIDPFLQRIREMGYRIKVDTNGSMPHVLARLIQKGLVDYLAMDVKGPLGKYSRIVGREVQTSEIRESIALIVNSGIEHEFRTTVVRSQLDSGDLIAITELLQGARLYVLQTFVPRKTLCPEFLCEASCSPTEYSAVQKHLAGKKMQLVLR
jgi:pyruvate formate lyase activating enzyme